MSLTPKEMVSKPKPRIGERLSSTLQIRVEGGCLHVYRVTHGSKAKPILVKKFDAHEEREAERFARQWLGVGDDECEPLKGRSRS